MKALSRNDRKMSACPIPSRLAARDDIESREPMCAVSVLNFILFSGVERGQFQSLPLNNSYFSKRYLMLSFVLS